MKPQQSHLPEVVKGKILLLGLGLIWGLAISSLSYSAPPPKLATATLDRLMPLVGADGDTAAETRSESIFRVWEDRGCLSEDYDVLSLLGDRALESQSEKDWMRWTKDLEALPYRSKVKHIFINMGYVSGASLGFLARFPAVEELTLGISC